MMAKGGVARDWDWDWDWARWDMFQKKEEWDRIVNGRKVLGLGQHGSRPRKRAASQSQTA